jgi:hypothetical protein
MKPMALSLTRRFLLVLVAASFTAWGARTFALVSASHAAQTELAKDGLIVVNFHGVTRCNSCKAISKATQTVVENEYSDALNSGDLKWRVLNFDEPASRHFVKDYGIVSSTVVLVRRENGKDIEWRRLDAVWDHLFDDPAMKSYLKEEIAAMTP